MPEIIDWNGKKVAPKQFKRGALVKAGAGYVRVWEQFEEQVLCFNMKGETKVIPAELLEEVEE